ncbi:molybdopterin-binding protein [Yoonia sp. R78084]|uniref:molybdopterin-binding protein n=1 Tax=Yoonia sp. R78084 TaxID=3093869 RepID=UPI0037DC4904
MKFGPVPTQEAAGAVLAHSVPVKAGALRKGQILSDADIAALLAAGHAQVIVARYDPGDLNENTAAAQFAAAIAGAGLHISKAATGRVNLFAKGPGIVQIDAARIDAANAVNPMITVATVLPLQRVEEGAMVATIKIISYAVPADDVTAACAAGNRALALLSPRVTTASLIETDIGKPPATKGRRALASRLSRLGVTLTPRVIVPHAQTPLAEAIKGAEGEVIFILTASATSDVEDVGPSALRQAGGKVTQFGMPVDPGNLLFLGNHGEKPVVGLPGCARSPALNGADWVLERVICGLSPTPADFTKMGVGGLLKEIPSRPKPRANL